MTSLAILAVGVLAGWLLERVRSPRSRRTQLAVREPHATLSEGEKTFRRLAETTAAAIFIYKGKRLVDCNPATEALTGYTRDELLGMEATQIVLPSFRARFEEQLGVQSGRSQIKIVNKRGEERWLDVTTGVIDAQGETTGIAAAYDLSPLKSAEEQLRILAYHDGLTGLPNRAMLVETLRRLILSVRRRRGTPFGLLYLDLDDFKIVNESLGQVIGDSLLAAVARRIEECIRPEDTVARLSGDEFAVLLPEVRTAADAIRVAKRIHDKIRGAFRLDGRDVFTTTSIGIAMSDPSLARPEDLLGAADTAMYRAKEQGKSRYQVFDPGMHTMAIERLQLETDLQWAIERREFRILFQPIVELDGGAIRGFEALARWQHPTRGILSPKDFIPVAEETGMIVPIGWQILRDACRQVREWQRHPGCEDIFVTVNLSGKQFTQSDMVERVASILAETGLPGHKLGLEIVESMLLQNADSTRDVLRQLKALGVRMLIDDFGTGYSSLSYLHRFPTSGLKIDRSFVKGIDGSWSNAELVKTIVTICQGMNMDVVAEGVETSEQAAKLIALGCRHGQGYYFARPMEAEKAGELILKRARTEPHSRVIGAPFEGASLVAL